jgi:hypothetical protein
MLDLVEKCSVFWGVGFKEVVVYYFSSARGCNGTYRRTNPEARERP